MNQGVWLDCDEKIRGHRYELSRATSLYEWYLDNSKGSIHQPNYHHTVTIL